MVTEPKTKDEIVGELEKLLLEIADAKAKEEVAKRKAQGKLVNAWVGFVIFIIGVLNFSVATNMELYSYDFERTAMLISVVIVVIGVIAIIYSRRKRSEDLEEVSFYRSQITEKEARSEVLKIKLSLAG